MPNSEVQMHGTGQSTLAAPVLQPHNINELWRWMKIAWRLIQGCQSTTFGDTSRSMTIRMASLLPVLIFGTRFSSASARFPPHPVRHHYGCCNIKMLEYPEREWTIPLPQGKEYWHIFNLPSVILLCERSVCQSLWNLKNACQYAFKKMRGPGLINWLFRALPSTFSRLVL